MSNEATKAWAEAQEAFQLLGIDWAGKFGDGIYFGQIRTYIICADSVPHNLNLTASEMAFLWAKLEACCFRCIEGQNKIVRDVLQMLQRRLKHRLKSTGSFVILNISIKHPLFYRRRQDHRIDQTGWLRINIDRWSYEMPFLLDPAQVSISATIRIVSL